MASVDTSGTVMFHSQRLYINIETLCGKNPTEIHITLCEVCGEQTVDRSTVFHWAIRFREGCITINDDPIPGTTKTSTDE
jgi:hypothetical protein